MHIHRKNRHRHNPELTPQEQAVYDEIMENETPEELMAELQRVLERFPYTSSLLFALATIHLDEYEDVDGNLLLLGLADDFAQHEAKTV